jgi:hypothetical protein
MARRRFVAALGTLVLIAAIALVAGITVGLPHAGRHTATAYGVSEMTKTTRDYIGLWVTEDHNIRQALLPNGRYIEARGHLEGAYQGNYQITGNHIEYQDDTGFVADGDFIAGVLHHAGMVMYAAD